MRMDEKGVSPVIGVILMVAITVILAAVIASFVFGLGGTVKRMYNVAATASVSPDGIITITYHGGPDHQFVQNVNITSPENCKPPTLSNVGDTATCTAASGTTNHVVVVAMFKDGTQQVILETDIFVPTTPSANNASANNASANNASANNAILN
ncbi:MAG: archaeal type pilus assembly protein PilA [Archaeoglobaceae archaeon]|nr:archaeal type pilus assembly protein PilA [Archaeoglobaceae archaeon]